MLLRGSRHTGCWDWIPRIFKQRERFSLTYLVTRLGIQKLLRTGRKISISLYSFHFHYQLLKFLKLLCISHTVFKNGCRNLRFVFLGAYLLDLLTFQGGLLFHISTVRSSARLLCWPLHCSIAHILLFYFEHNAQ